MEKIDLHHIDEKRKNGLRPEVVGCFVNNMKVFVFYDKKHEIWQFPQGGIDNHESVKDALKREMIEECGQRFYSQVSDIQFLAEDKIVFPQKYWGSRSLRSDEGREVKMKGKHYFAFVLETKTGSLILQKSQFDDYICANYDQALSLFEDIYQAGKRRLSLNFLQHLYGNKLIK